MPRLTAVGLAALSTGLLLAACGSPSHPAAQATALSPGTGQSLAGTPGSTATGPLPSASAMPGMSMGAATTGAPPAVPVSGDTVAIKGFAFAPAALVVKVGATVTWTNQDGDAHTVTSQGSGGPLHSAALATGQSYSHRFTAPGTYPYLCTIHPFMTATVTVTA
ncbi:cupredoxin domain-containing protein [Streptacidiphilus sp. PAMC 29251]